MFNGFLALEYINLCLWIWMYEMNTYIVINFWALEQVRELFVDIYLVYVI